MKVGVFAGTPVDTEMGAKLLRNAGYDVVAYSLARSCEEQNAMQYYSADALEDLFESLCREALSEGAQVLFLYCNSLSAAIDYMAVSKRLNTRIICPLEVYEKIPEHVRSIFILSANALSAFRIEEIIRCEFPEITTMSLGILPLVNLIEQNILPAEVVRLSGMDKVIEWIGGMDEQMRPDAILLGCTHFPYIKEEIRKLTDIEIIDPDEKMLEMLSQISDMK